MCTKIIRSRGSIDTLDRYPPSISQSILSRHADQYSVDTLSAVDQQSIDNRPSVYESIENLVDFRPRCRHRRTGTFGLGGAVTLLPEKNYTMPERMSCANALKSQ